MDQLPRDVAQLEELLAVWRSAYATMKSGKKYEGMTKKALRKRIIAADRLRAELLIGADTVAEGDGYFERPRLITKKDRTRSFLAKHKMVPGFRMDSGEGKETR